MNLLADSITAGFLWGTIVTVVIACISLIVIYAGIRWWNDEGDPVLLAIGVVILLGTSIGWAWSSWPLDRDYHWWQDREGIVVVKSSRLLSDGDKGINQKFVVRLKGSGDLLGINDTRAALLKPGDRVHLACKKANEFGIPRAAHGWDCRWLGTGVSL